ncbi:MAG: hypothetical protein EAZ90_21095 [Oscillatoriales cyanobacterium]|nr:MAG: hypothetical protein EAZ94_24810 [Oscillatoriales cyanobacterium]TAE19892.1 MAG: hypothetical protein EAZ93_25990 [Oscillatoriales cyanobacterium]TAE40209.1 MAG: hypothetical protein EAZ90_21095 [Oscillatoriales cyanobacterium]TAE46314.1 MAG: hypothetical protein EAZ88_26615 [Oscillatoriales cyanobacterium]TAF89589.1 MAG: hypothetical protein EAZ49_12430 [Oscillatoriales cyanobacterium]
MPATVTTLCLFGRLLLLKKVRHLRQLSLLREPANQNSKIQNALINSLFHLINLTYSYDVREAQIFQYRKVGTFVAPLSWKKSGLAGWGLERSLWKKTGQKKASLTNCS